MLSNRVEKLQDSYAIQVTSHFHQHNSDSEKWTLIAGRQRFLLSFVMNNYLTGSENPPVQADFFILWQKKFFCSALFRNLIICCLCFSTEVPERRGGGVLIPFPSKLFFSNPTIPFPFFYCFSFMNPIHSTQNPISHPLKKANPSSHFIPSGPS